MNLGATHKTFSNVQSTFKENAGAFDYGAGFANEVPAEVVDDYQDILTQEALR